MGHQTGKPTADGPWAGVDLDEFCGGFDYLISEQGALQIQITPGASPVVIAPKKMIVERAIRMFTEQERKALSKLPETEVGECVWARYVEQIHKPWLQHARWLVNNGNNAAASLIVAPGL